MSGNQNDPEENNNTWWPSHIPTPCINKVVALHAGTRVCFTFFDWCWNFVHNSTHTTVENRYFEWWMAYQL